MPVEADAGYEEKKAPRAQKSRKFIADPTYDRRSNDYNRIYPNLGRSEKNSDPRPKFSKAAIQLIESKRGFLTEKGYNDVVDVAIESTIACGKKTVSEDFATVALNAVTKCEQSRIGLNRDLDNIIPRGRREKEYTVAQVEAINERRKKSRAIGGKDLGVFAPAKLRPKKVKIGPSAEYAALQVGAVIHYLGDRTKSEEQKYKRLVSFFNDDTANEKSWGNAAEDRLAELAVRPISPESRDKYNKLEADLNYITEYFQLGVGARSKTLRLT